MTIAEIIERVKHERDIRSRFPVRVIHTDSIVDYSKLVQDLSGVCDETLNLADYCAGSDTAPDFRKLKEYVESKNDKTIMLISVGEYLRLCIKREQDPERKGFGNFWEMMISANSKTKCIVPIFYARNLFERAIGQIDERQIDFVWTLSESNCNHQHKKFEVTVYSPNFKELDFSAIGLKDWLNKWNDLYNKEGKIRINTRLFHYSEPTNGIVSLNVVKSPFHYLRSMATGFDSLEEDLSLEIWPSLVKDIKPNDSFERIVKDRLNIVHFDFVQILNRWKSLSDIQKNLVWLWYKAYPCDNYYCRACNKAKTKDKIPESIRDEIFSISNPSDKLIDERSKAMNVLDFPQRFSPSYFKKIDKIPNIATRFKLLTYKTHEERTHAIKLVSELLRENRNVSEIVSYLGDSYPALNTYLTKSLGLNSQIDQYFDWYKRSKLINRAPAADPPYNLSMEKYDARYKQLGKYSEKDRFILWIDGFGLEWVPVFLMEVEKTGVDISPTIQITSAIIPTTTQFNKQWENDPDSKKLEGLDLLAHEGQPDDKSYYSCIERQASFIAENANKVAEYLDSYDYVIVTGDHGSSRLAALAFHSPEVFPIDRPKGSKIYEHGRFIELGDNDDYEPTTEMTLEKREERTFVVLNNYRHFTAPGNVAGGNTDDNDICGEIHGGNTPEERLVPVIVFKNKKRRKLTCRLENESAYIRQKKVKTCLIFSHKVKTVEVISKTAIVDKCEATENGVKWNIFFSEIKGTTIDFNVIAGGRLIQETMSLIIKTPGITQQGGL